MEHDQSLVFPSPTFPSSNSPPPTSTTDVVSQPHLPFAPTAWINPNATQGWQSVGHQFKDISISYRESVWGVGTDGWLYVSRDLGYTFQPINPPNNKPVICVSAAADGTVYTCDLYQQLHRLNQDSVSWTALGMSAVGVSCGAANQVWCWDNANDFFYLKGNKFVKLPGYTPKEVSSTSISIGFDGTACCVDANGKIHKWDKDTEFSRFIAIRNEKSMKIVHVASNACMVGLDLKGIIHRYYLNEWIPFPGEGFVDAFVAADGTLLAFDKSNVLHRWAGDFNPSAQPRQPHAIQAPIPALPNWDSLGYRFVKISVAGANKIWAIGFDRQLYHSKDAGSSFKQFPPPSLYPVISVKATLDGSVYATDGTHTLYQLDSDSGTWKITYSPAVDVEMASKSFGWAWDSYLNCVYTDSTKGDFKPVVGYSFSDVNSAKAISTGCDRTTLLTTSSGKQQLFEGGLAFVKWDEVKGQDMQVVSVASNSMVAGLDDKGMVYRYFSGKWIPIGGSNFQQVALATDGTLLTLDKDGTLYRHGGTFCTDLVPASTPPPTTNITAPYCWEGLKHQFWKLSVGSAGNVWAIDFSKNMFVSADGGQKFWPAPPFHEKELAFCVSAAEDGTVYATTASAKLYTLESDRTSWRWIEGIMAMEVSVGSADICWVMDNFGTAFFLKNGSFTPLIGYKPYTHGIYQLSIGKDKSVMGVGNNNQVFRWKGNEDFAIFEEISGKMEQISVGNLAMIAGINEQRQLCRFERGSWVPIAGTTGAFRQVQVGGEGTMIALTAEGEMFRWTLGFLDQPQQTTEPMFAAPFQQFPPTGSPKADQKFPLYALPHKPTDPGIFPSAEPIPAYPPPPAPTSIYPPPSSTQYAAPPLTTPPPPPPSQPFSSYGYSQNYASPEPVHQSSTNYPPTHSSNYQSPQAYAPPPPPPPSQQQQQQYGPATTMQNYPHAQQAYYPPPPAPVYGQTASAYPAYPPMSVTAPGTQVIVVPPPPRKDDSCCGCF